MTVVAAKPIATRPYPAREPEKWSLLLRLFRTTDHKQIGTMYLVTSFAFFMIGGAMAMLIRSELARPGLQFLSQEQYNQLFTMHGTVMLLLYPHPASSASRTSSSRCRSAHPTSRSPGSTRSPTGCSCSAASSCFLTPGGAADFGWFAYTPLSDAIHSPGVGADLWITGLIVSGLGTILGAVNMVNHRAVPARAGHDDVPDADLHLEHPGHQHPHPDGLPHPHRGPDGSARRLQARGARVRPRKRRGDPLAAPVLVLRSPRGLHSRAAVLRHRLGNLPRLRPQTRLRLQRTRLGHPRDRRHLDRGVGAPHVRHRRRAAAVLLERRQELPVRRDRHRRRPVGLRQLARMGDVLPAAAAQLHRAAPDPFRAAGLRAALPAHDRTAGTRRPHHLHRKPRPHAEATPAPSEVLTDAVMPGTSTKDTSAE